MFLGRVRLTSRDVSVVTRFVVTVHLRNDVQDGISHPVQRKVVQYKFYTGENCPPVTPSVGVFMLVRYALYSDCSVDL